MMARPGQTELFQFDGETYVRADDQVRLSHQLQAVWKCMNDGSWRTLQEIMEATGVRSSASVSARLRDLRKESFGGHTVNRRHRGAAERGIYEYQVIEKV